MNLLDIAKLQAKKEREATILLLQTLVAIEEQRLHLKAGFRSMFHFLTCELLYSESAANRRISAARAMKKFPELKGLLLRRKLSLSTLCLVANQLTDDNFEKLLASVAGKPRREVEALLSNECPPQRTKPRERIQTIAIKKQARSNREVTRKATSNLFALSPKHNVEKHLRHGGAGGTQEQSEFEQESRLKLAFSVNENASLLIEEAKVLLSGKYPRGTTLENLFVEGLVAIIREKKMKRSAKGSRKSRKSKQITRHIPAAVERAVRERDGECCSYVSAEGRRCRSKWDTELDHIKPFAKGGEHTVENLRVLCRAHNALVAEEHFGRRLCD